MLPALEELQTAWEKKAEDPHFKQFHQALHDGLAKMGKYYNQLDEKLAFVLALGELLNLFIFCSVLMVEQFYIPTTSLCTSRWLGVVPKSKPRSMRMEMRRRRTGMMKP